MPKKKLLKIMSKIYLFLGIFLIFIAFITVAISFYPQIWYSLDKGATEVELATIERQITLLEEVEVEEIVQEEIQEEITLPPVDSSLPTVNTLRIGSIGVDSEIVTDSDPKIGLQKGIWIVPDWGTPEENDVPIIIAAHRFGYSTWTREFREKSSFFNLPKLNIGDRVQIIWGQRSYEYEVYMAEDNTQIVDYSADLILYTCRMYNSPVRVFRYLNRVN